MIPYLLVSFVVGLGTGSVFLAFHWLTGWYLHPDWLMPITLLIAAGPVFMKLHEWQGEDEPPPPPTGGA